MTYLKSIFFFLIFASCTVSKPTETVNTVPTEIEPEIEHVDPIESAVPMEPEKKYNVKVTVIAYIPYCNGAAPSPDQLNRNYPSTDPLIAINSEDNSKTDLWVNEGAHFAYLSPGKYFIKEKFKDVPLLDFINAHKRDGMYYLDSPDDCYEDWRNTNLFEFEILKQDTIVYLNTSVGSSCFTGNNPCLQYTGPYPP